MLINNCNPKLIPIPRWWETLNSCANAWSCSLRRITLILLRSDADGNLILRLRSQDSKAISRRLMRSWRRVSLKTRLTLGASRWSSTRRWSRSCARRKISKTRSKLQCSECGLIRSSSVSRVLMCSKSTRTVSSAQATCHRFCIKSNLRVSATHRLRSLTKTNSSSSLSYFKLREIFWKSVARR